MGGKPRDGRRGGGKREGMDECEGRWEKGRGWREMREGSRGWRRGKREGEREGGKMEERETH